MEMAAPVTLTIEEQMDKTICKVCSTTFSKFSNLATHIKRKHPGKFKTEGKNIRFLKHQGSNKTNGFCPAEMEKWCLEKPNVQFSFVRHMLDINKTET
ncbi:hypothetical protein HUJ04_011618 [Dendroctonus ponderosae]|nr:hypothetical protein HUJ04_011618 [Dendroctonus ponderosae]